MFEVRRRQSIVYLKFFIYEQTVYLPNHFKIRITYLITHV
jgi:hypothetical protein